jgi:hypothetical protein
MYPSYKMAIGKGLKVNLGLVISKCQAVIFFLCTVFTWIEDDPFRNFNFSAIVKTMVGKTVLGEGLL